ncbi:MAG: hypothetical protein IJK54_05530 [Clostridia bacterium]|nr:hypothetical protein [Clostridia bacterium]
MDIAKTFPPYMGEKPYLYLCFADADEKRVRPLLKRLWLRGVRVWYAAKEGTTAEALRTNEDRMRGAALVVLYLDEAFRADLIAKGRAIGCGQRGQAILCLNTDGGDSALSIGLPSGTPTLLLEGAAPDGIVAAILRSKGFTQDLIGQPQTEPSHWVRKLAVTVATVAVLLLAGALLYSRLFPPDAGEPQKEDTILFSDPALTAAVRGAVGGPITEESLSGVTTLRFTALPENLSGLALLANLERIELTQDAVVSDAARVLTLSDTYEIVLIGGDAP